MGILSTTSTRRRQLRSTVASTIALAATAAMATTALTVASPAAGAGSLAPATDTVVSGEVSAQDAADALAYWTPERMASAQPADLVGRVTSITATGSLPSGPAVTIPGTLPSLPDLGLSDHSSDRETRTASAPTIAREVPRPYTNTPDIMNGRVFFTMYDTLGRSHGDWACSGTSTVSAGRALVWTAGHCIHGGAGYSWHRNWVFVPAYSSTNPGDAPFGTWTQRYHSTLTSWVNNSDLSVDLGAATVNRVNNVLLSDRIGAQGIGFNDSRSITFHSYGYPGEAPFNGLDQYRCDSAQTKSEDAGSGPDTIGIRCDMTGGSSGGGWVARPGSNGIGYVESVNSYGYPGDKNTMYGPYHGSSALNLYNAVKDRTA